MTMVEVETENDSLLENSTTTLKSVIVDESDISVRRAAPSTPAVDEESRKRGRRMMGVLMGTLNQFRKETDSAQPALERQKQIQAKLAEKMQQEKALLAETLAREREQRQRVAEEAQKLWDEQARSEAEGGRTERKKLLANFLKTKTEPSLCFLPGILTEQQQSSIDQQITEAVDDMLD